MGSDGDLKDFPMDVASKSSRETLVAPAFLSYMVDREAASGSKNVVRTSRFTKWSFVPLALWANLSEPLYAYLLLVSFLQQFLLDYDVLRMLVDTVQSPLFLGVCAVIAVSMVRMGLADMRRHRADAQVNNRQYPVFRGKGWDQTKCSDLQAGDILCLPNHAVFPADMVLLCSSTRSEDPMNLASAKGFYCWADEAVLDGELALRPKRGPSNCAHLRMLPSRGDRAAAASILQSQAQQQSEPAPSAADIHNPRFGEALQTLEARLVASEPAPRAADFRGSLTVKNTGGKRGGVPSYVQTELEESHLLLAGTSLQSSDWAVGVVAYTGKDTVSAQMRAASELHAPTAPRLMVWLRRQIASCILLLLFFSLLFMGCGAIFTRVYSRDAWYMPHPAWGEELLASYLAWVYALSGLLPMGLLLSVELMLAGRAWLLEGDVEMYDEDEGLRPMVRDASSAAELGQVTHVFADKTGTLTMNIMAAKTLFIGDETYGSGQEGEEEDASGETKAQRGSVAAQSLDHLRKPWDALVSNAAEVRQRHETQKNQSWLFEAAGADVQLQPVHSSFGVEGQTKLLSALWPDANAAARKASSSAEEKRNDDGDDDEEPKRQTDLAHRFLTHMALSNTLVPHAVSTGSHNVQLGNQRVALRGASPDEEALATLAQQMGFELVSRNPVQLKITRKRGLTVEALDEVDDLDKPEAPHTIHARHLATLPFTPRRKRVTVVYEIEGRCWVMCKGADMEVRPLLELAADPNVMEQELKREEDLTRKMTACAAKGRRTLMLAHQEQDLGWWQVWSEQWDAMRRKKESEEGGSLGHSHGLCRAHCEKCKLMLDIEESASLTLLGGVAMEDTLQELAAETVDDLCKAGLQVWMTTGDKLETGKGVARAVGLLDPDMDVREGDEGVPAPLRFRPRAIHITGAWARYVDDENELKRMFDLLAPQALERYTVGAEALGQFLAQLQCPLAVPRDKEVRGVSRGFQHLFKQVDADGDGEITLDEFKTLMTDKSGVTLRSAVQCEIEEGLQTLRLAKAYSLPVTVCLSGQALEQLYAPNANSGSEETEEEQKEREEWLDKLFELCMGARAVVACRMAPKQKAELVRQVQARGTGDGNARAVVMAIGDGANDSPMLAAADVGVALLDHAQANMSERSGRANGSEGGASATLWTKQSPQYAISQFRALHSLLFVHGWPVTQQTYGLVGYMAYKSALLAFACVYLAFGSGFNGSPFFNPSHRALYELVFTSIPVVVCFMYDRPLGSRADLHDTPQLFGASTQQRVMPSSLPEQRRQQQQRLQKQQGNNYNNNNNNSMSMTRTDLIGHVLKGALHSFIVFVCVNLAMGDGVAPDGVVGGAAFSAVATLGCCVVVANLQLLLRMRSVTLLHIGSVVLSLGLYLAAMFPMSLDVDTAASDTSELGVFEAVWKSKVAWLAIVLGFVSVAMLDLGWAAMSRALRPTVLDVYQEMKSDAQAAHHAGRTRVRDEFKSVSVQDAVEYGAGAELGKVAVEAIYNTLARFHNTQGANFDACPAAGSFITHDSL